MDDIFKPIIEGIQLILYALQLIWNEIVSKIPKINTEELIPAAMKAIQDNWNNPGVIIAIAILIVLVIKTRK